MLTPTSFRNPCDFDDDFFAVKQIGPAEFIVRPRRSGLLGSAYSVKCLLPMRFVPVSARSNDEVERCDGSS